MMWMVKKKKKIIGTKRTRKSSLTNLNQRPVDNDNTNMMQWSFDLHAKNPSLSVDIDGVSLQWNMNRTWGLCRGSCYFNHGIGFYEVVKKEGKSQQIKLGICGKDVDCSKDILQNDFNGAKVLGFWVVEKVKPPIKKGDKIGVEINFRLKYLKIYKNYVPISEKSFENMNFTSLTNKHIYPFIAVNNDVILEISESIDCSSYTDIKFNDIENNNQLKSKPKPQKHLPTITENGEETEISKFLSELGLSKYIPLFQGLKIENITRDKMKELKLPTVHIKVIFNSMIKKGLISIEE